MKISHPVSNYSGPVVTATGRRVWFVGGQAEATNLAAAERRSMEDAGFTVESPRAKTLPAPKADED